MGANFSAGCGNARIWIASAFAAKVFSDESTTTNPILETEPCMHKLQDWMPKPSKPSLLVVTSNLSRWLE
jgi:hypothetical protein